MFSVVYFFLFMDLLIFLFIDKVKLFIFSWSLLALRSNRV